MAGNGSLRLLVETTEDGNAGVFALRAAMAATGIADWSVERLFPDDPDDDRLFLLSTTPPVPVSVRQSFDIAYHFESQSGIDRVEPDVPVVQYPGGIEPEPVGAFEHVPTPEDLRWAREAIRCDAAWGLPPATGGATHGAGIRIGHPDTGYTPHFALGPDLETLDLVRDRDFIDDDHNARDPLSKSPVPLARFPGHGTGTGTGSVIIGRGDDVRGVVGVAPRATLVPIRACLCWW
jgi:thermitase